MIPVEPDPPRVRLLRWIGVGVFVVLLAATITLLASSKPRYSIIVAARPEDAATLHVDGVPCPGSVVGVRDPSLWELAHTSRPCRAAGIVDAFARAGRLDEAREAVAWDFALIAGYVVLFVWAATFQLRSVRLRMAAWIAMGMAILGGFLDAFENWRLLELLGGRINDGDLTRNWVSATAYAAHFKWPLIVVSGVFAVFSTIWWVVRRIDPKPHVDAPVLSNGEEVAAAAHVPFVEPPGVPTLRQLWTKWLAWRRTKPRKHEDEPAVPPPLGWLLGRVPQPELPRPVPATRDADAVGICCSGGGVRSAAFNLGVLQELQESGGLQRAKYLAAVSGGSYIASALTMVAQESAPGTVTANEFPFRRGSSEEQYLRNHSSYLAPGVTGKAELVWQVVRGLVINLALVFLLLLTVGLPLGWLLADGEHPAGIPPGSVALLRRELPAAGGPERPNPKRTYRIVVAPGSRIRVSRGRSVALDPDSQVVVPVGNEAPLIAGQPVVVDRAHEQVQRGRVLLAPGTLQPLKVACATSEPGCTASRASRVELDDGQIPAAPNKKLRLASGELGQTGTDDTLVFAAGSSLIIDRPVQLRVAQEASLDLGTGHVSERCGEHRCVDHGVSHTEWLIIAILAAIGIVLSLIAAIFRVNETWTCFLEAWGQRALLGAIAAFVLLVALPELVEWFRDSLGTPALDLGRFSVAGVLSVAAAVLLDFTGARAVAPTVAAASTGLAATLKRGVSNAGPPVRNAIVSIVGAVIGPLAILAALLAIVIWGALETIGVTQATIVFASVVALVMIEATGDLTRWSMHPFYKRRLASAFALERYPGPDGARARAVDYDQKVKLSELEPPAPGVLGPELVVCAAANLSDPGAEPPGRPVSTFTFSHTHVGGGWLGLLNPKAIEDAADRQYERDVTLSAAVAISGAAISPAMGKIGKRRYSFLLGLANVRLGVWLPNPLFVARNQRRATARLHDARGGDAVTQELLGQELPKVWGRSAIARPHYLIKEMLGRTSYRDPFVYVTDGGHFENLGLVELLRRGCNFVYCFDASGGDVDSFATLGQAIAIARSELGVEITIDPKPHPDAANHQTDGKPDNTNPATDANNQTPSVPATLPEGIHIGRIRYPDSDQPDGRIIFARAIVTEDAPWDVRAYKERDPKFPTHGLLDQLYTDEKFEAYRALGHFMATRAVETMHGRYDQVFAP